MFNKHDLFFIFEFFNSHMVCCIIRPRNCSPDIAPDSLSELIIVSEKGQLCVVPKPLTLYTHQWGMGKKNKVIKLTDKIYHSGQKERREHQKDRGGYEVESVLCEACLDTSIHDGKKVFVCVVLDDSSRRILAGGEFDAETTENSLWLLREAIESLDTKWYLQTPDIAFWSRLPEGCKLGMFLNRMETELNG
jgi:hypothetical protein